jgi:agmatine deiminase
MPKPVYFKEIRLPASYANFLITNEKVLVPVYRCSHDETALKTLQELFPKRKVIGLDCTDVVYGLGAIHCLSMQVPV